jgi:NADH-quinone oxidoreductase subunit F
VHILLRDLDIADIKNLDVYLQHGGYEGLKKALAYQPAEVIEIIKASGLRGRGGAGFPTGTKWSFIPKDAPVTYVVVNADESEPGTFKDRQLLEGNPHQVIEGALIAAYAIRSNHVYIYCRGEFHDVARELEKRIDEAWANGFIGPNILGSGWDCQVHVHLGAGAYICGEETSLLESIEGKRGEPRIRPPFPATFGLYGCPTVINNVETLANVPVILDKGAVEYCKLGTPDSPGVKIFSLSGHVKNPGNYELPFGGMTTFRKLIEELGGGTPSGLPVKGILPAGASGAILPATDEILDTPITYGSFKPWNTDIGSASVIVLDESVDMVWAAHKMTKFFEHESCGQCTPCREGTYWLSRLYGRVMQGMGDAGDVETLNSVASQMKGKCICALGEFAVNPVVATIKHFPQDYERAVSPEGPEMYGAAEASGKPVPPTEAMNRREGHAARGVTSAG